MLYLSSCASSRLVRGWFHSADKNSQGAELANEMSPKISDVYFSHTTKQPFDWFFCFKLFTEKKIKLMPHEKYQQCIDACSQCAVTCQHCAAECLKEDSVKEVTHVYFNIVHVKMLHGAIVTVMKQNHDGNDFAGAQARLSLWRITDGV